MKRLAMLAGVLFVLALLATTGCYTVLRHPTGTDVVEGGSYYRSCADCHADAEYYHPYYRYGRSHYRWNDYYGYPWWYDDYWWRDHDHHDDGGESIDVERGGRHLWGTGSSGTGGWGFTKQPTVPPSAEPPRVDAGGADEPADDGKKPELKEPKQPIEPAEPKKPEEQNPWTGKKKGS